MSTNNTIYFNNPVPLIIFGISSGFKDNGWNVIIGGHTHPELHFQWNNPTKINVQMKKLKEEYNVTHFFCDFGASISFRDIHDSCKRYDIKFIIWGIEDVPDYEPWHQQSAPFCDVYLTTTIELLPKIKNKKKALLNFGVNKEFHNPLSGDELEHMKSQYNPDGGKIILCANNYSSRVDKMKWFLEPLLKKYGKDVHIYGNAEWLNPKKEFNLLKYQDSYKGYLSYSLLPVMYSSYPVVLGVNCNGLSATQMSMRMFEYAGVCQNSCMVSFHTKAQEAVFGDLLYLPKNEQQTLNMVDIVLNMSNEERNNKCNELREFVYANHTYGQKIKELIDKGVF